MKLLIVLLIFMGLFLGSLSILSNWEHCPRNTIPCAPFCLQCDKRCNRKEECADGSDEYECARCGALPTIQNGQLSLTDLDSSVDATANVICNDGYKSCDPQVTCHCSKVWGTAKCVPEKTNGISCYSCNDASSNDDCARKEDCPHNKQSCETTIVWFGEAFTIKKGCKNPNAGNENLGCKRQGPKTVCKYKCEGDLCNDAIPISDCDTCGTHEDDADGQNNEKSCRKEHGRCTPYTYDVYRGISLPLKSSGCKKYCVCTNSDGFRWMKQRCPYQTLFDINRSACSHKSKVECLKPGENDCMKEHGVCDQTVSDVSPKVLSGSGCKKYCECECDQALNTGRYAIPIYHWAQRKCPQNKKFDENKGRCSPSSKVQCGVIPY